MVLQNVLQNDRPLRSVPLMPAFDPVAATAAYMATLTPAQHARATAYTHGGEWILLWNWVVAILVLTLITRTRLLPRLRDRIDPLGRHPLRVTASCIAAFTMADWLLSLPWTIYTSWWREAEYGLTSQPLAGWFTEALISLVITTILSVIFFSILYALMRATRLWWAWAGGVAAIFIVAFIVLAPIVIEPLFNRYTPAPPGPVRDAVTALAQKVGVPSDKILIFDGSRQSNRYTANVDGLFGSARIAMSDVMFAKNADVAEVRGVVGHEMGHYVLHHALWFAGLAAMLFLCGAYLSDRLFGRAARMLGAPGIAKIADPTGLPVFMALLTTLVLLSTPILNTISRTEEAQADHFSLVHANEPDGLAKSLCKTIEYRASSPSALEEFLFYDHPSVEHRVQKAMAWKATHPAANGS
jgi:STE24 endopeptidase